MKDQELVERNNIAQLFDDYALEVSDRGHDASNPWIMADKAISLCRQHDMQMAIEAADSLEPVRILPSHYPALIDRDELKEAIREMFNDGF